MRLKKIKLLLLRDTGIACSTGTFFRNRDFGTRFYGSEIPVLAPELKYPLKKVNMSTLSSCRDDPIFVTVLPHPEKKPFWFHASRWYWLYISCRT
jgi:hypothetical protein